MELSATSSAGTKPASSSYAFSEPASREHFACVQQGWKMAESVKLGSYLLSSETLTSV